MHYHIVKETITPGVFLKVPFGKLYHQGSFNVFESKRAANRVLSKHFSKRKDVKVISCQKLCFGSKDLEKSYSEGSITFGGAN